ncbi:hypothetical protein HDU79_006550 [Rhizoclosmatium sp. JEL0117]|nr:hypothetical protein HDU79_006550 [Rhizoclosmatium sp. JEL0117]
MGSTTVTEFIDSSEWRILVPGTDSQDVEAILSSTERGSAWTDELFHFYVVATSPGPIDATLLNQIDIQVSAAASTVSNVGGLGLGLGCERGNKAHQSLTVSRSPTRGARASASGSTSASGSGSEAPLFSYAWRPKEAAPRVKDNVALFPLRVPLSLGRVSNRGGLADVADLRLSLTATVQPVLQNSNTHVHNPDLCDPEDFDAANLFDGLVDDPFFNPNSLPNHRLPFQFRKHSLLHIVPTPKFVRKVLPLTSALRLSASVVHPNSQKMILSTQLLNSTLGQEASSIQVLSVTADMTDTVIQPLANDSSPVDIHSGDESCFLFSVFKLDRSVGYSSNVNNQSNIEKYQPSAYLSFTVQWTSAVKGLQNQVFESKWYCLFDAYNDKSALISAGKEEAKSVGVSNYDLSAISKGRAVPETVGNGLEISFRVMPPVQLRNVFTVEMLVVNSSPKSRKLRVSLPQQYIPKASADSIENFDPKIGRFTQLHMPVETFLNKLIESEAREANIFCLESNFDLGEIPVGSCQSIHLHFIALRGNLHTLEALNVIDEDDNKVIELRKFLQIYAQDA